MQVLEWNLNLCTFLSPRWSLVGTATYIQNPEHVVSPGVLGFARNAKWDPKKTSQALRRGLLLLQSSHRGCLRCAWQFNSEARNHLCVSARGFEVGQTMSLLLMLQKSGGWPVDLVPIKKHPRWSKISSINSIFFVFFCARPQSLTYNPGNLT